MLSFCEYLVCVCVLFIYTISISILCVSREEFSFIKSNQQIYDFIQCNTNSCCEHLIYIYMGVSVYWPLSVLRVFACVWYQIRVLAKNHITCQTSLNLTPSCGKHTAGSFWYQDTKAPHEQIHNIIKLITHQMWLDHPFSQRNKAAKWAVKVEV